MDGNMRHQEGNTRYVRGEKNPRSERGMVTLEACVFLLIFMFIMLFMLGLFQMSMAQGATAHAVMQSSQSLSMDAYSISKLSDAKILDGIGDLLGLIAIKLIGNAGDNPNFVTEKKWYGSTDVSADVLKLRFIGYLSGGDEAAAQSFLKLVRVVDGLDGLDFSETEILNGDLYFRLKYKVQYAFTVGSIGEIEVKQTAVTRLWLE